MFGLRTSRRYFINALLAAVLLASCEGSTAWREKRGLIKEFDVDFLINSIRVDDDGEYHIVAVASTGSVKTMHDADVGFDIDLHYSNISTPILRVHYSYRNEEGKYYDDGTTPKVILPFGYKIETFAD